MDEDSLIEYLTKYPNMVGLFAKMINQYVLKVSPTKDVKDIAHTIKHLRFNVLENLEFKNAQVTAGGINISEVKDTMESKYHSNLYFLGEVLDVDGICGGYNLHFAFASAYVAALDIINKESGK